MKSLRQQGERAVLLPVAEFASRLGVSLSTARKLCYSRAVSSVKFNKSLMVPAAEVDQIIARNLTPALPSTDVAVR